MSDLPHKHRASILLPTVLLYHDDKEERIEREKKPFSSYFCSCSEVSYRLTGVCVG